MPLDSEEEVDDHRPGAPVPARVDPDEAGNRLDAWAARHAGLSRNRVQALIAAGAIKLDGRTAQASVRLRAGDVVTVALGGPGDPGPHLDPGGSPVAEDIPLAVVYEDDDIAVIDKPAGMVVHPAPGHPRGTLVNALMARYPEMRMGGATRPGIVHRLDRDTSGLIVVARHDAALAALQAQFRDRTVEKLYLALVDGHPRTDAGTIEAPVGRRHDRPDEMGIVPVARGGRPATTRFRTVTRFDAHAFLECVLVTGRTHQIRVHLGAIGTPVVGDRTYGRATPSLPLGRQFLHAASLGLVRPDGRPLLVTSPLPGDLAEALASAGPAK